MADDNIPDPPRRSVRKVSQNSYIKLRNAKTELREKVRKVTEVLRKPEHERSCADQALVIKHPEIVKTSQRNAKRLKENKDRQLEIEDDPAELAIKCERLAELIKSSEHVVVYTGAGISTAASIPDYRGPNGVWTLLKKGQELCPQDLSDAEPTYTHMCLTKLFRVKKVKHVVSQNCDGLHIRSGFPRYSLSELHGNMYIEMCYNCAPHREYVRLFDVTERTSVRRHTTSRRCRACGVNLTDTIVHFGEKGKIKSPYRWKEAVRAAKKADLILCLGSSLKVLKKYQCLWCMDKKPHLRPKLAIVNLQWTPKDDVASLKISGRCDSVMRMVMKLLDENVPEYQRELDPIFRICTPLRASELKTTCKKILIPPALLARPPKQTKNSKNKGKTSTQCQDSEQTDNLSVSEDKHECEPILFTESATLAVDSATSAGTNLPSCTETGSQPSSHAQLISQPSSHAQLISQPLQSGIAVTPDVSAPQDKCHVSIMEFSSADQADLFSSSTNHLLKQSLSTNSVAQETFMTSASGTSEQPVIVTSWPVASRGTDLEQTILPSTYARQSSSPGVESLPTIVVVNLDTPTESPSLYHHLKSNVTETVVTSNSALSSPVTSDSPTLVSSSTSYNVVDASQDVSPFPVLLTYVTDGGQPLSIPLNNPSEALETSVYTIPSCVPLTTSSCHSGKNISLDHSYVHDTGTASAGASGLSRDSCVQGEGTVTVPSHRSYDSSQDSLMEQGQASVQRKSHSLISTSTPSIPPQPSASMMTCDSLCMSSPTASAPMCVLNMDEMETVYTLPEESSHLLTPTAGNKPDITLEFELPAGCEILTMDMLGAMPLNVEPQGTPSWQALALGNVMHTMKMNDASVNSILSSALEPVVCNLALDNTQMDTSGQVFSASPRDSTQLLSVNLDTVATSGSQHAQHLPELTRLLKGNNPGLNNVASTNVHICTGITRKLGCPGEERKPLSPRSSDVISSGATSTTLALPAVNSMSPAEKPLLSGDKHDLKNSQHASGFKQPKVRKQFQTKNITREILNHMKAEGKQVGLENICGKVGDQKCSPTSVPGWFGKGLGLKKKRK